MSKFKTVFWLSKHEMNNEEVQGLLQYLDKHNIDTDIYIRQYAKNHSFDLNDYDIILVGQDFGLNDYSIFSKDKKVFLCKNKESIEKNSFYEWEEIQ